MKLRILLSAVLVTALALPVIATMTRFPDVPTDHQHADAVRWASDPEEFNGNPLFRGFPNGNFGPDEELTEGQFVKVVDRLFDSADRWTRAETAALLYYGFQGLKANPLVTTTSTTTTTQPVVTTTIQPQYQTTTTIAVTTTLSHQQLLDDWQTESDRIDNLLESIEQNLRLSGWDIRQAIYDIRKSKEEAVRNDRKYWRYWEDAQRPWTRNPWTNLWNKWQSAMGKANKQQNKVYELQREYHRQILIPPDVDFIDTEFYSEGNEITSFDIILSTDINEMVEVRICGIGRRIILNEGDDNRVRLHCPSDLDTPKLKVFYTKGRRSELSLIDEFISMPTGTNTQLNTPKLKPQIRIIEEDQNPNLCCQKDVVVEVIVGNSDLARRSTATGSSYTTKGVLWFYDLEFADDRFRHIFNGWTIENNIDSNFGGIIHLNEPGAPTHHLAYNSQMVVQSDRTTGSETS